MKGFEVRHGRVLAASAAIAVTLVSALLLWPRPAPTSVSSAGPARAAGAETFDRWCSDCHSTSRGPGSMALQRKHQGRVSPVLEQRRDLDPAYVALVVRQGISFMPSFRKTEISDGELALLAAYLAPSGTASSSGQAATKLAGRE